MLKILVICAASFSRKQPRLQAEQCFRVLLPECSWVYSYGSCGQDWFFETQITEIAADTAIVAFVWIFCALFEHFTCEDRHKKAMNQHLGPWLCVFCFYFRLGFRCNLCIFYHILMFAKESKTFKLALFSALASRHLATGLSSGLCGALTTWATWMGEAPWLHMAPYGSMARLDEMFPPNFRQVASTITNGFIFQALVSVSLGNNDFFQTRSARRSLWIWYLHCIEIALPKYLFKSTKALHVLCLFDFLSFLWLHFATWTTSLHLHGLQNFSTTRFWALLSWLWHGGGSS